MRADRPGISKVLALALLAPTLALQVATAGSAAASSSGSDGEVPLEVEVKAGGSFDRAYPWTIVKDVDRTTAVVDETGTAQFNYTVTVRGGDAVTSGWSMQGEVTVTNPNDERQPPVTLTDGSVMTDLGGGASCTFDEPVTGVVVPSADSVDLPFSCSFVASPATSGSVEASVAWEPFAAGAPGSASDSSDVDLSLDQEVDKTVDVIDDKTDPANPVVLEQGLVWAPGLVRTYTYSMTHQGTPGACVDHTNTALVDVPVGEDPSDSTTVTVCDEPEPAPSLTTAVADVSADLVRSYAWSIDKDVDATRRNVNRSGKATFTYTVVAKAGAATDSGWRMAGSATVTNPSTSEGGDVVADVVATTTVGGGAACSVTGGDDVGIAAGASVTLPVTCSFTSAPQGSGQLTVTATWDPPGEAGATSVSVQRAVSFAVRAETNKVVNVVDDKTRPGERVVLEQGLVWAPGLVRTYTYSVALTGGQAGACVAHTNVAQVEVPVGTNPSDSVTVQVCAPEVAPAQSSAKAKGWVRASCQGTVRARLNNRTGQRIVYKLRIGKKVHKVRVARMSKRTVTRKGPFRTRVVLKVGRRVVDRARIPARCRPPEALPDTGLRTSAGESYGSIEHRRH